MIRIFTCFAIFFSVAVLFYFYNPNSKDVEKVSNEALIIAHRGAVDQFNENTIEAYEQSIKDGANWIEIDIRMTSDGVLVPMHDVDIDRTTTGTGEVNDLTWKQLSQFETVKNGHRAPIPKLEEVFQKFGQNMHYYIETRSVDGKLLVETKLISLLKKYDLLDKELITIASFETESLEKIKEIAPSIPLVRLYKNSEFSLKDAVENDYELIGLESLVVSEKIVKRLHEADKKIHVYFNIPIIEKFEQKRVRKLLVDGYITNSVRFTKELIWR
ncbi:glycerophosphodiester phosphodiesterase [Solibacillus sp. R5-41]|uniref:glycerophosphodiester phosphodiesterase n=1 Tax=Solibacillus sp. R5-41 TaxID=2048654 RepID=UPI000C124616|nr:glycerophosphodiester phosphodiesterase family protein [Solibacillus sp. R5-41]ATP40675.1 glycerophosphodiester phosphodiesterase [Solibacillus sp. R5-41]